MSVRRLLVAVIVVALVAPACSRGGGDDDAYVLQLDGTAEIVRDDGSRRLDDGDHRLSTGDTVRMVDGDATLELPGDRSMLLRAGREDRDASVIRVAAAPEVVEGDAVVVAADELDFRAGDVEVVLRDGAARVHRGLGVTVAVYEGAAQVSSAGRELAGGLGALRQVSVPATGLLPREPSPLLYDEADPDPWDRRFLGDAIDLGAELDRRSRSFTGEVGGRTSVDAPLLRRVLPRLADERDFADALLTGVQRTAGEALVGAAIVVEAGDASFRERWDEVFSFRADGARWGLVALDQQVRRDAVLGTINDAFSRSPLLFAVADVAGDGEVAVGPPPTAPSGDGQPSTPPAGDGDGGDGEGDEPAPTPTIPPPTLPPITIPPLFPEDPPDDGGDAPDEPEEPLPLPEDPEETVPEVVDVVQEVVEDLLGDDPLLP